MVVHTAHRRIFRNFLIVSCCSLLFFYILCLFCFVMQRAGELEDIVTTARNEVSDETINNIKITKPKTRFVNSTEILDNVFFFE